MVPYSREGLWKEHIVLACSLKGYHMHMPTLPASIKN